MVSSGAAVVRAARAMVIIAKLNCILRDFDRTSEGYVGISKRTLKNNDLQSKGKGHTSLLLYLCMKSDCKSHAVA